jgi:glycosyltransferase involved in cell wall biosynthesis
MARVLLNLLGAGAAQLSGIGMYTASIYAELLNRGRHDYVLLTSWKQPWLERHLPLDRVTIVRGKATPSEKLQYWLETAQVSFVARQRHIDTVFTPWPLAPIAGGRKRILVLHDLYRRTHPELHNWHYQLAWNTYFPLSVAASSHVVCVSEATASEFRRHYPRAGNKAITIGEASTILATPSVERPMLRRYGLCVSSNMTTKNLPRLIEAAELLRRRGVEIPIVWIGKDKGDVVRQSMARFPELKDFILPGWVDEQQLATWYAHADFYVAPSLTEGFCLPVVEAQKFGVPVICSDIDVLREVAGQGARFFDPLKPAAIADAVAVVATDRAEHDRLSVLARSNAARFSWAAAAAKLEALF